MTPASPAETAEQRTRAVNMITNGHVYEAVAELIARACPNRSLHTVEGAPMQALADLLRTATELDSIADAMTLTDWLVVGGALAGFLVAVILVRSTIRATKALLR